MEKNLIHNEVTLNNSILTLTNRKKLTLTNVSEIISSNETTIILKVSQNKTLITGKNINITKLDVDSGLLEAEGLFNSIKYDNKSNESIIKRLFKWF